MVSVTIPINMRCKLTLSPEKGLNNGNEKTRTDGLGQSSLICYSKVHLILLQCNKQKINLSISIFWDCHGHIASVNGISLIIVYNCYFSISRIERLWDTFIFLCVVGKKRIDCYNFHLFYFMNDYCFSLIIIKTLIILDHEPKSVIMESWNSSTKHFFYNFNWTAQYHLLPIFLHRHPSVSEIKIYK